VQRTTIDNAQPTANASGVRVLWAANSTKVPVLDGNTLRNLTRGVFASGPGSGSTVGISIVQNTIEQNTDGIRLLGRIGTQGGGQASITGNFIRNNTALGILLDASGAVDPFPRITGNDLHGNSTWSLQVGGGYASPATDLVTATGNWWGTTSLAAIRAKISDQRNVTTAAVADWRDPLDASIASGGAPIAGNFLVSAQPSGTVLTSGATYDVLSVLTVPAGANLTIPAGTTLRFQLDTAIDVSGTLTVQGGLLTSAAAKTFRFWQCEA